MPWPSLRGFLSRYRSISLLFGVGDKSKTLGIFSKFLQRFPPQRMGPGTENMARPSKWVRDKRKKIAEKAAGQHGIPQHLENGHVVQDLPSTSEASAGSTTLRSLQTGNEATQEHGISDVQIQSERGKKKKKKKEKKGKTKLERQAHEEALQVESNSDYITTYDPISRTHIFWPASTASCSSGPLERPSVAPVPSASGVFRIEDLSTTESDSVNPSISSQPGLEYLESCSHPPHRLDHPTPKLLILDLNGTLVHRQRTHGKDRTIDMRSASEKPILRPYLSEFMDFVFNSYSVMFWSSATPRNVDAMINATTTEEQRDQVIAVWARNRFGLSSEDYYKKTTTQKNLRKVFRDKEIRRKGARTWDISNTVLMDDSSLKAALQPFNHILVPEFKGDVQEDDDVLSQVIQYLDELRYQEHVGRYIMENPFHARRIRR